MKIKIILVTEFELFIDAKNQNQDYFAYIESYLNRS